MPKRFTASQANTIHDTGYFKIRCGDHRMINVWVVVLDGRVFVRTWNDRKDGWYRAFLANPGGAVLVGTREVAIRASRVTSARMLDAVSDGYAAKYVTKANAKYVKGFRTAKRKANTLELTPD